jgi:hypothetical protein
LSRSASQEIRRLQKITMGTAFKILDTGLAEKGLATFEINNMSAAARSHAVTTITDRNHDLDGRERVL